MIPFHKPNEIPGMRGNDGTPTILALLLSDQCPYGITVIGPDGTSKRASGSVLTILDEAKDIVNTYNCKSVVNGSRIPVDRFPRPAVREAVLNAISHRDYSVPDDILITVTDDHITVMSPGAAHRRGDGIRNPLLVSALELFRIKGYRKDGIAAIRKSYSRSGYEPRIVTGRSSFLVVLPAVREVRGYYQSKVEKITAYMSVHGGVTSEEIERLLKVSRTYTFKIISHMESDGIIFSMYGGKMRRYFLCQKRRHGEERGVEQAENISYTMSIPRDVMLWT